MSDGLALSRRIFRQAEKQAEMDCDGFVVVDALDREAALLLRDKALALLDADLPINDPQQALYGTLFDPQRRQIGEELANVVLRELLDSLLDNFRYEGGYLVAKPGGSSRLDLHQHQPVTNDIFEPAVHIWLTLDDCGAGRGGLRVVRGSHGLTRHVQSFASPPYFRSFSEELEGKHAQVLDLRAGQAVIFERSLLHGSEANDSPAPRLRLLGTAIPDESALCILSETTSGTFEALEVGGANIEPDLYCIADQNRMNLPSRGFLANRNVDLTEQEFLRLVSMGRRIAPGYDPIDEVRKS